MGVDVCCREDECERVRKFGARIMTLDQIEGLKVCSAPVAKFPLLHIRYALHVVEHATVIEPMQNPTLQ